MSTDDTNQPASPYVCEFICCNHRCKSKTALKRHYAAHGVKSYHCPYCNKKFSVLKDLNDHAYSHIPSEARSSSKPFACSEDGCTKRFRKAWRLAEHQKSHTLLEMSESSREEWDDLGVTSCGIDVIESIYVQIQSITLPQFFYTRVLPYPSSWLKPDTPGEYHEMSIPTIMSGC